MPDFSFREWRWVTWLKFFADLISLQIALYLGYMLHLGTARWLSLEMSPGLYRNLAIAMLAVPLFYGLGHLYPGYGLTLAERLRRRFRATIFFFAIYLAWDTFVNRADHSRGILLATLLLSLLLPPITEYFLRMILIRLGRWGTPVLVLGAGQTGQQVVNDLMQNANLGFRPVALLDDDSRKWGMDVAGIQVVGGISRAREYRGILGYALLAIPDAGRPLHVELSGKLEFLHIIMIPDLDGIQGLWSDARDIGGIIGVELHKSLLQQRNWHGKRLMDYILGIPLFLLSVPFMLLFALWISLVSPGNPFYCQVREGRGGKKFRLWKLRTMYPDAEKLLHDYLDANPEAKQEWNLFFKLKNDPRIITGVGHLLRRTSLDELPQFWNVLRGEMTLVGPRPFPHYHLERFNAEFRSIRRSVLPGMTGLWQVSARSDGDLEVQEKLDTYYIRNWSFWLDLSIFFRTIWIVLTGKGAY